MCVEAVKPLPRVHKFPASLIAIEREEESSRGPASRLCAACDLRRSDAKGRRVECSATRRDDCACLCAGHVASARVSAVEV